LSTFTTFTFVSGTFIPYLSYNYDILTYNKNYTISKVIGSFVQ